MTGRTKASRLGAAWCVCLLSVSPAVAQDRTARAEPASAPLKSLFVHLGRDVKHLGTRHTVAVIAAGAALAAAVNQHDAAITRHATAAPTLERALDAGEFVGGGTVQAGGAVATALAGWATGNHRAATIGSELLQAQIVNGAITQGLKYGVRRTRPDGSRFSFPSGHSSATFASAAVLQREFGWTAGAAAYGVASYVAVSRLSENKHFASDVAVGAAIGIASGHAVTFGRHGSRITVDPYATPHERGVRFSVQPTAFRGQR